MANGPSSDDVLNQIDQKLARHGFRRITDDNELDAIDSYLQELRLRELDVSLLDPDDHVWARKHVHSTLGTAYDLWLVSSQLTGPVTLETLVQKIPDGTKFSVSVRDITEALGKSPYEKEAVNIFVIL